jgi:cytochrome c553
MIKRLLEIVVRIAFAVASLRFALDTLRSPSTMASAAAEGLGGGSFIKRWLFRALVLMIVAGVVGAAVVVTGVAPIKASNGHWAITEAFLQFAKRRSVAAHSMLIKVPPLDEERLVAIGAGHYDFACRPCHGSPALEQPRIARQMLPRPPDLRLTSQRLDPEDLFYIVKHGIKLTGMPAWPARQRDDEVWAMVAFLRKLPQLDARAYSELARGGVTDRAGAAMEDLLGATEAPRAIVESCGRCHGIDGLGRGLGAFPILAGQRPAYLFGSMQAYARGERHSGIMEPLAASLGADEMQTIADYYSRLSPSASSRPSAEAAGDFERGRAIATTGVPEKLVPACVTCHGPTAQRRNPNYPLLAGQHAAYIRLQLSLFKGDRRGGTSYRNIMRKVAIQLTEEQMRDVAAYFASLPGGG